MPSQAARATVIRPGVALNAIASQIANDFARGVVSRHAGHAAARMRARAAQVKALQRHAVIAVPEDGPRAEELVERELAVEDVAAHETEVALEVQGRENPSRQYR